MGAKEALLKSMYMQQSPHLSEEDFDNIKWHAIHSDNSPTPRSSTSTHALDNHKV